MYIHTVSVGQHYFGVKTPPAGLQGLGIANWVVTSEALVYLEKLS